MIVEREDYELKHLGKTEEVITIALNIHDIENIYMKEEENYVEKMTNMFVNNWQEVCLGEKVVSETIDLCKDDTKQQMSKELFLVVHRQIRLVGFKIMIILQINQNLYNLLQRAYSAVCLLSGRCGLHFCSGTTQSIEEKSWLH